MNLIWYSEIYADNGKHVITAYHYLYVLHSTEHEIDNTLRICNFSFSLLKEVAISNLA